MSNSTSVVRLFVGFILTATGVHASCPIELSPPSVVVRYGDSVSVNCSTSAISYDGIGWEVRQGGTGIQPDPHLTWQVKNLTDWTIVPQCFINTSPNGTFKQCTKDAIVVVYTFPENITISSSSGSDGVMNENREYNLTCHIHHVAPVQNVSIMWYKGDNVSRMETFDNPTKEPVYQFSIYSFKPTKHDNGVKFRCEAHMDLGPEGPQLNVSSEEYSITVYYGPEVQHSVIDLLEGETLESQCRVEGNPTPVVRWKKDGQVTDPSVALSRKDAGLYVIEANGTSYVQKEILVRVMYGPECSCPRYYEALENSPLHLNCSLVGHPEPKTTWYKDGEEVELPVNLARGDTGQYVMVASNNVSTVNATVEVIVKYPPSLIVELEDSEVQVGSAVWLKCSSKANPRPTYSWNYYRAANVMEESEDGVSRLLISNATAYNMGLYTCHATNWIGNVSKAARVTVKGAKQECPIEITPDRMVLPYQGPRPIAVCKLKSADVRNVKEIYWKIHPDIRTHNESWHPDTRGDWNAMPVCTAILWGLGTCSKPLKFTLYKTPDSVSIRPVHNLSSLVEGTVLQLQCDIISVAPAQNLTVRWYHGNITLKPLATGSMHLTGLPFDSANISRIRVPVNMLSTVNITLNRTHHGAEFRCEALLDLGSVKPQPPSMVSDPLNISVHYKPVINTTKLPKRVPVFSGYPAELVCEAEGHPPPKIEWLFSSDRVPRAEKLINVSKAGLYNCTATNEVDSVFHVVEVISKEDYLPLIAGFVAVTVVAISIVFVFIYSIYYKNTKMRRYSLKNPKLNTQNSYVAHNGWDQQLPMYKLS